MEIRQIIDKINENQIFVPAFQREYVWKRPHAKALFNSLIKRYPTGTLLTWQTNSPPELKGPVEFRQEMGSVKLVLDGQQRITTLYMILTGKIPPYYTQQEITHDVRNLHVNIRTLELEYYKRSIMAKDPAWVNLTDIFTKQVNPLEIIRQIADDQETESQIYANFRAIESIPDRVFPEQIIPPTAKISEAINIFYIVNASGVNLTDAELALAQISGYWPKARETFKKKLFELNERGFVFKLDFIVYCLLAVLYDKGSELGRLHNEDNDGKIQEAWERLETKVLDYVVNILNSNAYIDHTDEINSVYALIPIISYVYKKPDSKLTEDEIKKAIKWFYHSQIWQRYISQMPQKLDRDLGIVRDHRAPFEALLDQLLIERRSLKITKDDFVGRDVRHPLFSLMRWFFKSQNAVCLGTGVGLRINIGERYHLEKDHIFPYSALRDNGYPVENRFKYALAQEITNRAILTQLENRSKSATAAHDYLNAVAERFPGALEKQCIPTDPELWKLERYEEFLAARREILVTKLNAFLDGITVTKEQTSETSIEDIIATGEHDRLEFKATLRWDRDKAVFNRDLEKVILKTIVAFSNADGGTLLIGVDNDCNPVGLDDDYATLNDGTRDEFELHLRNLIGKEWGGAFAANNLKIKFPEARGVEICEVGVKPGNEPLYLEIMDRNGHKQRKFFVRSGNSSPPLDDPVEIAKHMAVRFPHLIQR